ncbi:MAG: 50S ribosomal protein L4 [Gammaproteobacteria bacterium]|nr:50S ribosomal protein L4 [Gammaproteobacteria bacterium]MDH5728681.1 50S ribosomal protein L4 [Gammaproteobacteria bacterium]
MNGGGAQGQIEVSDAVYNREFNESLVHQTVVAYLAAGRAGTRAQKSRSDVSGGGAKPFRQKGTGRARAGTIRSPIWRSGGKTFAAKPQDYTQKLNKKMRRAAMQSILSELARQDRLVIVEDFGVDGPKTKELFAKLKGLGLQNNCLVVTEAFDQNLYLSGRNLPNVQVKEVANADPVSLVGHEKVLLTVGAAKKFEELLA